MSNDVDALRDEYPEELIKSGVRGKYTRRYRAGTNVVLIDPDLHELFPDSEAVNRTHASLLQGSERETNRHPFEAVAGQKSNAEDDILRLS